MSNATRSIPIPFVFGFYLTAPQMRIIAREWLAPEIYAACQTDRDYQRRLVDHCRAKSCKWTFLPDSQNETGEECYLWVTHVIPSWDGKNPRTTMPRKLWANVEKMFGFNDLKVACMMWPRHLSPPTWMMSTMLHNIKIGERNRRQQDAQKESGSTAVETTQQTA
ncbi:hypothetical protein GGX14DRAFT_423456 [Mycena pura]|uniref:Uncharacterized protein n=1 Tax=Mycena pura TaxID=153505 RepID=A0AAD7E3U1_9AGAR|nr:hypothetical protein GGX14DRAFT_423456 [Mycena pura]